MTPPTTVKPTRACRHWLPGFEASFLTTGVLYVLMGGSILVRGTRASMAPFGVPEATLASPHYDDAIFWVYSHMVVLGVLMAVVGLTAEGDRLKLWFSRALFAAHVYYTVLDVRASDSVLGTALYQGPASIFPAVVGFVVTVLLAHLSFCLPHGKKT
jgi:hypothetical protein